MKSLPEYPTELDLYLNSLLDQLRTKYYNVSVNRGSEFHSFFYNEEMTTRLGRYGKNLYFASKSFTIPNTELLIYFEQKQTPPQIKQLLK